MLISSKLSAGLLGNDKWSMASKHFATLHDTQIGRMCSYF